MLGKWGEFRILLKNEKSKQVDKYTFPFKSLIQLFKN